MVKLGQTGLVFMAPEAEPVLSIVASTYPHLVRPGLPAHITVLYPWIPIDRVSDDALGLCAQLAAATPRTKLTLNDIGIRPGFVYLSCADASHVEDVCNAAQKAWPDLPPYGGKYNDSRPHITLALGEMRREDQEVIAE